MNWKKILFNLISVSPVLFFSDYSSGTSVAESTLPFKLALEQVIYNNQDGFAIRLILTNLLPRPITLAQSKSKSDISSHWSRNLVQQQTISNYRLERMKFKQLVILRLREFIFLSRYFWNGILLCFEQEFVETGKKQYLSLYPHGNALRVSAEIASEGKPHM